MKNTRFMEVMFSNTDEELAKQVDSDIKKAAEDGSVDTEEVRYDKTTDGNVAITDKENGEVTIAEKDPNEEDTYNLVAVPDEQLERFVHPSADGQPSDQVGAPDEKLENHFQEGCVISPNLPDGGLNPEAGYERRVEDIEPCEECDDEREFSVTSDNEAWQKIFSMPQEFCEMLFSEVIESSETSKVGDLKIEKCADEEKSVVVTSESTGDQVKVSMNKDEIEITELTPKNFSNGQYLPYYIVGINPYDHYIADAQEWGLTNSENLKAQLEEDGIESVQIFDNQDEARDYAFNLLSSVGANPEEGDVDEPEEQREYSEYVDAPVFTHSYRTDDTVFISRLFSEVSVGIHDTKEAVENAIEEGDEVDLDGSTVTPIDEDTAIIEDGGEFTKATLEGEDMVLDSLEEDEAKELLDNAEEKKYSEIYTDESETRFFSENEDMTSYMERIFSGESDQDVIEDAISNGEEIENDIEVITPVDAKTAVVEDKESGEFTKITLLDEDQMNIHPIDDDEAQELIDNLQVEDKDEDEDEDEKEYSEIYTDESETRFFSENEDMTSYMERIFSGESDQDVIEDAIESGEQIENDSEVVTPVDAKTAVVEDKESGEFTKATINDEDSIEINKISEEEADDLTENLQVEDKDEDEDDNDKEEEKEYSVLGKFFAEVVSSQQPSMVSNQFPVNQQVAPASMPNQQVMAQQEELPVDQQSTVEDIEDKALAAVQSIKVAAEEATAQIMEAKAAPIQEADPEIQEAQFSEKTFSHGELDNTLVSWLQNK